MEKYKFEINLTGSVFFGETFSQVNEFAHNYFSGWQYSQGERPSTGWRKEFTLEQQSFYILDERADFVYIENTETHIRFWINVPLVTLKRIAV